MKMTPKMIKQVKLYGITAAIVAAIALVGFFVSYSRYEKMEHKTSDVLAEHGSPEVFLDILEKYDPDGYFILKTGLDNGDDISSYYEDVDWITDVLPTIIHEECHNYSRLEDKKDNRLYTGDGNSVIVTDTEVFPTVEMADSVPEECRTMRFDNYVGSPAETLAANNRGVYGLLNEFCAYTWGNNTDICMYPYIEEEGYDNMSTWKGWLGVSSCNRLAYAEFKYYILHYLAYAKENHPDVYEGIMNNENFREAYRILESKYSEIAQQQQEYVTEIVKKLDTPFSKVEYTPNVRFLVTNTVTKFQDASTLGADGYDVLLMEIAKQEHKEIHDALVSGN